MSVVVTHILRPLTEEKCVFGAFLRLDCFCSFKSTGAFNLGHLFPSEESWSFVHTGNP